MTVSEVLAALEAAGTAQNRKVYPRHGVQEPMFGVSFAHMDKLAKQIKTDHALAKALWDTKVFEARIVATKVADPAAADDALLEAWVHDLDSYVTTDSFTAFVATTRFARKKLAAWTRSREEWVGSAGWTLVARVAMIHDDAPDETFEGYLKTIEANIGGAKNRVKYAMNNALIAIGIRNDALYEKAVAAARRIGKVDVDHGDTNCKTPDAIAYMQKTRSRHTARAKKAANKRR